MEALQTLLTIAIETTAIIGFGGIVLHAVYSSHCEWMKEYCPAVKPVATEPTVTELVVEPVATEPAITESMVEPVATEPAVTEPVVEPAITKYEAMNVKRLRQECQVHSIDWKKGGDYGKPMRKNQMIRALTA